MHSEERSTDSEIIRCKEYHEERKVFGMLIFSEGFLRSFSKLKKAVPAFHMYKTRNLAYIDLVVTPSDKRKD